MGACAGLIAIAVIAFYLFRNRKKGQATETGQGQSAHDSPVQMSAELGGRQLASSSATVNPTKLVIDVKVHAVSPLSPSTPQLAAPVVVQQPWSGHELGAHTAAGLPVRGYELGTGQHGHGVAPPQEMGIGPYRAYELGSEGSRTPELPAHVPPPY